MSATCCVYALCVLVRMLSVFHLAHNKSIADNEYSDLAGSSLSVTKQQQQQQEKTQNEFKAQVEKKREKSKITKREREANDSKTKLKCYTAKMSTKSLH